MSSMQKIWRFFREKKYFIYFVTFGLLFCLCLLFPYSQDDWAWGSEIGIRRLNNNFAGYGGRYFGYLIVMAMTRLQVVKALVMAGTLVGIGCVVEQITKTRRAFLPSIALLFLVAKETFAQAIVWTSGFANYCTTTLVVLAVIAIICDVFRRKTNASILGVAGCLLLGFAGGLIVENVSAYLVAFSIICLVVLFVKERRFSPILVALAVGAMIGSAWMFSNSAYQNIVAGSDSYRGISVEGETVSSKIIHNYNETIYPFGLLNNAVLNVSLAVLGGLMVGVKKWPSKKGRLIAVACSSLFGLYAVYGLFNGLFSTSIEGPGGLRVFEAVFSIFALLALVVESFLVVNDSVIKQKLAILWTSYFIIVAPLFLVSPIGPRNMLTPYALLVVICCLLSTALSGEIPRVISTRAMKIIRPLLQKGLVFCAVSLYLVYAGVYATLTRASYLRLQDIRNQIASGETTIVMRRLPFESFTWCITPDSDIFVERYKLFYDIPEEVNLLRPDA